MGQCSHFRRVQLSDLVEETSYPCYLFCFGKKTDILSFIIPGQSSSTNLEIIAHALGIGCSVFFYGGSDLVGLTVILLSLCWLLSKAVTFYFLRALKIQMTPYFQQTIRNFFFFVKGFFLFNQLNKLLQGIGYKRGIFLARQVLPVRINLARL